MEQHCVRHTELPGASRLFSDLIYHYDRVARFYPHAPHDARALDEAASRILYPVQRREAVVAALREQNPGNPSLDRLAEPNTLAVVTGQQVGLFGGPLYTIFKALAAARMAQDLTASGRPAVPIFWLATEDHDLAEINQSWAFGGDQKPVSLSTSAANPLNGPVGPIVMRDVPLEDLRNALHGLPFAAKAMELASSSYRDGVTFGEGFRRMMEQLLGRFGIVFLDPLAPRIRKIAAPFLARALGQSRDLAMAVRERNRELEAAGYHTQVLVEENSSLLFSLDGGRRTVLKRTDKGLNDFTYEELLARAETLSPNAILRPVMQDYLLPTVAYLGGPAELAYLAQSEPLYQALLGRMPVVSHRASFTLLDTHAAKLLSRYRIGLKDVAVPEVALHETLASRLLPRDLNGQFEAAYQKVESELNGLRTAVEKFDPGLAKAIGKSRAKALYQVEKLRGKAAREAMRRDEKARADADYLHNLIYPHRHLQERFYGLLPFLARLGMDLPERVYSAVRTECSDHQVLSLG